MIGPSKRPDRILTRTVEVDWSPLLTVARKRSPSTELDASSIRPNSLYFVHPSHSPHYYLATALFSAIWVDR
ncbi:hypothetical protein TNCV_1497711 [Trichonephila clavipes]|nr:hypothetical protein TNCV_1497711 [Trichonephila clavipes]